MKPVEKFQILEAAEMPDIARGERTTEGERRRGYERVGVGNWCTKFL